MKKICFLFIFSLFFLTSCSNKEKKFFENNNILLYSYKEINHGLCKYGLNNKINDVSEVIYGEYTVISIDCNQQSIRDDFVNEIKKIYDLLNSDNKIVIYLNNFNDIDVNSLEQLDISEFQKYKFVCNFDTKFYVRTPYNIKSDDLFAHILTTGIINGIEDYKQSL